MDYQWNTIQSVREWRRGDGVSIFKCRSCGSKSSDYKVTDDEGTTIDDIECIDCGGDYDYEYCHSCCPCPCVEVTA